MSGLRWWSSGFDCFADLDMELGAKSSSGEGVGNRVRVNGAENKSGEFHEVGAVYCVVNLLVHSVHLVELLSQVSSN